MIRSRRQWLISYWPLVLRQGLMGDPACAPVTHTTKTWVSKATEIKCCLPERTCSWWAHAASDSGCKQQQAGDSHGCHGHGLFGARPLCSEQSSVNEPCVQEVSGDDITTGEKRKKKRKGGSTWAPLHEPPHTAHSQRYAAMTHAAFNSQWRNELGPRTDPTAWNRRRMTWWAWHFIHRAPGLVEECSKGLSSLWTRGHQASTRSNYVN